MLPELPPQSKDCVIRKRTGNKGNNVAFSSQSFSFFLLFVLKVKIAGKKIKSEAKYKKWGAIAPAATAAAATLVVVIVVAGVH